MISSPLKDTLLAVAALAAGSSAFAGSVANVNLRLTSYTTETALFEKDANGKMLPARNPVFDNMYAVENTRQRVTTYEYGSKIASFRISNREFLEGLRIDAGLIDDIRGWSIVFVSEGEQAGIAYISKKGEVPINISEYLYAETSEPDGPIAIQDAYKYVRTERFSPEMVTVKETGAYKTKEPVAVIAEFPFASFTIYGTLENSGRLKTFGSGELQYSEYLPGAQNMKNLAGSSVFTDGADPGVVEGSISVTPAKTVDLAAFLAGS